MIYRWHGYGVDAMAVARPNENNYLFLGNSAESTRLLFSLRDNNNTNGFQFSITFIVVMNNLVY